MPLQRFTRIAALLGAAAVLGSCADPGSIGPRSPNAAPQLDRGALAPELPNPDLVTCSALPAISVTNTIGPEGGELQFGPHRLSIPAGALIEPVAITAIVVEGAVNHVVLQPEGLVFHTPVSLTMSYANCDAPDGSPSRRIAYTDALLNIRYYVASFDHGYRREVTGQLDHFSDYAVAW